MATNFRPALETLYQKSPIWLQNGICDAFHTPWGSTLKIPGGTLPIVALTEAKNLIVNLIKGKTLTLDSMAVDFDIKSGATLQRNEVAEYAFANQYTAANAVLVKPNTVSLAMHWPIRQAGSALTKTAEMMLFTAALDKHRDLGGTYIVITPAMIYPGCILLSITDTSSGSGQRQATWDLQFTQPLTTDAATSGALSKLYEKITNGGAV